MSRRFHACPSLFKQIDRVSSPPLSLSRHHLLLPSRQEEDDLLRLLRGDRLLLRLQKRPLLLAGGCQRSLGSCCEVFQGGCGCSCGVRLCFFERYVHGCDAGIPGRSHFSCSEALHLKPQAAASPAEERQPVRSQKVFLVFFFSCFFDLAFRKCRPKLRSWGTSFTFTRTLLLV